MTKTHQTRSRRDWMLGAGALAAVGGAALSWWRLQPSTQTPGAVQALWAQKIETVTGEVLEMSAFRGKPLLLNFWATWCPPCVEELPLIDAFWRANHANGFQVLALAIDQPSAVKRFLDRQTLGFPVGLAGLQGTELAKSLGNSAGGLPFSVFLKEDGTIWQQKLGQLLPDDLLRWRAQQT